MTRPLEMKVNLNVLEHLGMNLYSNVPAVLAEIVANSWDADASIVDIYLNMEDGVICMQDDGTGMTRDETIDRFLTIGYRRRDEQAATEIHGRRPMGRKGIGKLSSFSIAQVVTVYTLRNGEQTAFRMDANEIKEQIKNNDDGSYRPSPVTDWPSDFPSSGTRVVLSRIKKRMTGMTAKGLRQRLARRFSVIGARYNFTVKVGDAEIGADDRGYRQHVEFLWTYGLEESDLGDFRNLADGASPEDRTATIAQATVESNFSLSGWIGTVSRPNLLKMEDDDSLNRVAIFMRGKIAQEDVLAGFGQKDLYADYVVGEIHCDGLDDDEKEDIATSSRQALKYDDSRFVDLRRIIRGELRHVSARWNELRRRAGTREARRVPAVVEWLDELKGDARTKAERWIGRLNRIRTDGDKEKRELLKASILAFENYRRKEQLDFLDKLTDHNLKDVLRVFESIDDLELSYYGQIVNLRLGVITALKDKLDRDEKEKVIQEYIYDHLWLLDPSWERVRGSEHKEKTLGKFLQKTTEGLTEEQRKARIDIGYRMAAGRHVIIELKRASAKIAVDDLTKQIRRYRDGAKDLIAKSDDPNSPLSIVCLVGTPPPEWNRNEGEDVRSSLATVDAEIVFYDRLLDQASKAYADYLEWHKEKDRLWSIFDDIQNFAADQDADKD